MAPVIAPIYIKTGFAVTTPTLTKATEPKILKTPLIIAVSILLALSL